jgi:hypothetical protein
MPTHLPRPSVTLTHSLHGKVKAAAEAEGISVSQWLGRAARQRLAAVPSSRPEEGWTGAAPTETGTAPNSGARLPAHAMKRHRDRRRKRS